jgi:hypothetical protein
MPASTAAKRPASRPGSSRIGTLNEGPLHAGLKQWYAEPGDRLEVPVDGRQIDLVRGDLLIEIQTASLGSLKAKLRALLTEHRVRLVHPVPVESWIVRTDDDGEVLGRRKSPKRGRVEDAFRELVGLPWFLGDPNASLELVFVQEEQVRRHAVGRAKRRKGWLILERRLISVVGRRRFEEPEDLLDLLPAELPRPFTTADLAKAAGIRRDLAQKRRSDRGAGPGPGWAPLHGSDFDHGPGFGVGWVFPRIASGRAGSRDA